MSTTDDLKAAASLPWPALREISSLKIERDEARRWARKLYKEMAKLRDQLAEAQDDLRFQESVKEIRAVGVADQIRDLCDKRDEARNKALDEAIEACDNLRSNEGATFLGAQFCARDIRALKS